jgi:hypothetical protein
MTVISSSNALYLGGYTKSSDFIDDISTGQVPLISKVSLTSGDYEWSWIVQDDSRTSETVDALALNPDQSKLAVVINKVAGN